MKFGKILNEIVLALGIILQSLKFAFVIFSIQITLPLLFTVPLLLILRREGSVWDSGCSDF